MQSIWHSSVLRAVVATTTCLAPLAQATEPSAVDNLTPQSVGAVTLRLADLAALPLMQAYPVEVLEVATEDYLGIPLESIKRVTFVADPPVGATPQYAVIVNTTAKISFSQFREEILEQLTQTVLMDRPALSPPENQPMAPWVCLLDDSTLAIGPKLYLKRHLRGVEGSGSELAAVMSTEAAQLNHVHAAVMLEPIRPLVELGLLAAKQDKDLPAEAHKFLDALLLLNRVELTADFSGARESSLVIHSDDQAGADQLESLLQEGIAFLRTLMQQDEQLQELREHDEAVVRAWASYLDRMVAMQANSIGQLREGDTKFVLGRVAPGDPQAPLITIAVAGTLVGLLLPAVQAAREAARRNVSMNNLKQLILALHNYHDTKGAFPPQAICDSEGEPLLSWRVAILPYLGYTDLYARFDLQQPWNSEHNLPLLAEMPEIYLDPSSPKLELTDGKTHYQGVTGQDAAFTGLAKGTSFREFIDGTSKTLMVVQVDDLHAVEWTKPADYDFDAHRANPFGGIGAFHPGVFLGAFADGHTRAIKIDNPAELLQRLMTRNGREVIGHDELR